MLILTFWSAKTLPLDTVQVKNYEFELLNNSYKFRWVIDLYCNITLQKIIIWYSYELSNESQRFEEGILNEKNTVKFYKVTGFYKYRGTDGKIYLVNYSADDKGYQSSLNGNY